RGPLPESDVRGPVTKTKKPDPAPVEPAGSFDEVRAAARDCRRCDPWERATQTVFGAGAEHHAVMFVGEQPGDVEDQAGEPFVGPAGKLLRDALTEAG